MSPSDRGNSHPLHCRFIRQRHPKNIREFTRFLNHIIDEYTDSFTPKKTLPPLLTGRDLIREFDLAPSPLFSRILTHLEEERFAETITTRADALIWVKNFLKSA
ncbi:MAG: hypothetical protein R2874_08315 [Desulfobacterales bacterium]